MSNCLVTERLVGLFMLLMCQYLTANKAMNEIYETTDIAQLQTTESRSHVRANFVISRERSVNLTALITTFLSRPFPAP
jgi:hypothetical protein